MTALALVLALTAPALGGGPDLTTPPLDTPVIVELRPVAPPRTPPPTPVSPVTVPEEAAFFTEIAASAVVPKPPPPPPPPVVVQHTARTAHTPNTDAIARAKNAPNGQLPRDALCGLSFSSGLLRCDAAAALEAAVANGMPAVEITSTYRSLDDQRAVKASRGAWAAPVGYSNHGHAIAIDVPEPARTWLHKHGRAHGWTWPAWAQTEKYEPWHLEYTG